MSTHLLFYFSIFLCCFLPCCPQFCHSIQINDELKAAVEQTKKLPSYHYPHQQLVADLKKEKKKNLLIFAYGSLVNYESARRHLSSNALESRRPALAFGLIRLFDRDMPISRSSTWGIPWDVKSRGMLNVQLTHRPQDYVNGILIEVPIDELKPLCSREIGYDLVPVAVSVWHNRFLMKQADYEIAWTFCAPKNSFWTNGSLNPRPGYYELSRDSAKQYGDLFSSLWFLTTFCADGKTPIWLWERSVRNGSLPTLRFNR